MSMYGNTNNLDLVSIFLSYVSIFYNNGTLHAKELEQQMMRVIINCEMNHFLVLGLNCDAGGANARLYLCLRDYIRFAQDDTWPEDLVSVKHPLRPDNKLF